MRSCLQRFPDLLFGASWSGIIIGVFTLRRTSSSPLCLDIVCYHEEITLDLSQPMNMSRTETFPASRHHLDVVNVRSTTAFTQVFHQTAELCRYLKVHVVEQVLTKFFGKLVIYTNCFDAGSSSFVKTVHTNDKLVEYLVKTCSTARTLR